MINRLIDHSPPAIQSTAKAIRHHSRSLAMVCFATGIAIPATAANLFRGGEVYVENCEQCHGGNGRGVMPGTPDLTRSRTLLDTDLRLFDLISDGKGTMPGFQGVLSNDDILSVIGYLRTLR